MAKKLKVIMQQNESAAPPDFELNVDYYELKDGEYWPVSSLRKKYKCSEYHIYDRAKKNNVAKAKIAGVTLYKDMPEIFAKKPSGRRDQNGNLSAEHIRQYRTVQFAELCSNIRSLEAEIQQLSTAVNLILDHLTKETK